MQRLLEGYGYEKSNKGRTSGSRIIFKNGDKRPIMLHKPHPGNIVKGYALKQVYEELKEAGLISIDKHGFITLTREGHVIADKVYERHCVLKRMLTRIGVSPEQAEKDACKVEHVISEETFEAMKKHDKDN